MSHGIATRRTAGCPNALFADLYELAMMHAYHELDMSERAVFSLFVRKLPPARNFLIACGLSELLDQLEALRFTAGDIDYLASLKLFPVPFLRRLADFRFRGDVRAVPEGTPVFANEPLLQIEAPIAEAQLVETLVVNMVSLQTLLASKAFRVIQAARGRSVIDFGSRRAQGIDAALRGARAFHVAGVSATSNVQAGQRYGIPVAGTVAHSFVEACASEREAFEGFARVVPETTLLVDTYDTLAAVREVVAMAGRMGDAFRVRAIRLDSGDLLELSKAARGILDEAGLQKVRIIASGGLTALVIDRLLEAGAPIDAFGVGTDLSVSADAPALDIAYKLVEYAGTGRMKLSSGKQTLPGKIQVFRAFRDGIAVGDRIARAEEQSSGSPLLQPVMKKGRRTAPALPLAEVRKHGAEAVGGLPKALRGLSAPVESYPVMLSAGLAEYERSVRERIAGGVAVESLER